MNVRAFDFPGRGVGAFAADGVNWIGLMLTGLDGRDLNLQAIPQPDGSFGLYKKVAEPVKAGEEWPNANFTLKHIGQGSIVRSQNAEGLRLIDLDLQLVRKDVGLAEVLVSPPPPKYIGLKMQGVALA